ncbi:NAD(P)H nitroreductase [Actinosynnema pretiosum subsp. pretiosum]|uniref:Nitroreductase n=2 Tax=Actinosynnema TaxID=40566 RepID=C6WJX9_ACTMD|nr:NAD(P)H nitroreductase [Actinosynnema mirum]ACU36354.1 nitroreductase [Actinosynnema mirum DSM 43827]QUF05986.1 NAD(P)H nitroreductase [Actinosynnema pretiosum subsp. pretiosum]
MNRGQPDAATVRAAVTLACRAPSVHNTQPWRWRVGARSVQLHADTGRRLPGVDPDGADLLLSCGAALHHLRVALAAVGWRALVRRMPSPDDPQHLATVEFARHVPTAAEIRMATALRRRRTDRRDYSNWAAPEAALERLERIAEAEGVVARVAGPAHLVPAISVAAAVQAADPVYRVELRNWTGRGGGSPDGVPAASVPAAGSGRGVVRMREFPVGELAQPPGAGAERDEAALLVLGTIRDDPLGRLRSGEAMSAVLLAATAAGMATCPLTQPLEVDEARYEVGRAVFGGDVVPQVVLRLGWVLPGAAVLPLTPRRGVEEVVDPL